MHTDIVALFIFSMIETWPNITLFQGTIYGKIDNFTLKWCLFFHSFLLPSSTRQKEGGSWTPLLSPSSISAFAVSISSTKDRVRCKEIFFNALIYSCCREWSAIEFPSYHSFRNGCKPCYSFSGSLHAW